MGESFAFARWVVLAFPWQSSQGDSPLFYACARDDWKYMQRQPQPGEQT